MQISSNNIRIFLLAIMLLSVSSFRSLSSLSRSRCMSMMARKKKEMPANVSNYGIYDKSIVIGNHLFYIVTHFCSLSFLSPAHLVVSEGQSL